jgi:hypothetical protein
MWPFHVNLYVLKLDHYIFGDPGRKLHGTLWSTGSTSRKAVSSNHISVYHTESKCTTVLLSSRPVIIGVKMHSRLRAESALPKCL